MKRKNKSQSLLEAVLVFIGLVILLIGGVRLFSNLNQNQLIRLSTYRQSRLSNFNSLVSALGVFDENNPQSPKYYLQFGQKKKSLAINIPLTQFSSFLSQEERLLEAELKLKEFDNLMNLVLYYKINQMKKIKNNLKLAKCYRLYRSCCTCKNLF